MANVRDIPYTKMLRRELQLAAHARGVKGAKSIKNRQTLIAILEDDHYFLMKFGKMVKIPVGGLK